MSVRIYTASKTTHAPKWRDLRAAGLPIISTWIDEAGQGETQCFKDLWQRCVCEAGMADITIVYREPGEVLTGAFVEVGAALASFRLVFAVGCDEFSFINHPGVQRFDSLELAIRAVEAVRANRPFVTKVIVGGGQHPAEPSDPDAPIWRRQVLISCPEAIRAVCDHDGKRWRVEGAGWVMQPVGCVNLGEAEAICRAVERALAVPAPVEDPIKAFVEDCLVAGQAKFLPVAKAYKAYSAWCGAKSVTPLALVTFARRIPRHAPTQTGAGGVRVLSHTMLRSEMVDDITPEAVATLQVSADAEMTGETWETIDSPELHTLRDLAHVLDAMIEDGAIAPDGMGLVFAALARVKPENVHTGERCQTAECLVHGPCEECPTEAQWQKLDSLLTTWLAEHPREVVIHKTQNFGKTEMLPDLRPWQPAGAYPVDGTIIEVEGRPGRMRYCLDKTTANNAKNRLGGWLSDAGDDRSWFTTHAPTGRWRKASPVRV